ncbi:hypothetical protein ACLOJK_040020 [Asimina triloba]
MERGELRNQHQQQQQRGVGGAVCGVYSEQDFLLQWGNRKRLRCHKIQPKDEATEKISATVRVDRRVVGPDKDPNLLPRRPSSRQHRILRYAARRLSSPHLSSPLLPLISHVRYCHGFAPFWPDHRRHHGAEDAAANMALGDPEKYEKIRVDDLPSESVLSSVDDSPDVDLLICGPTDSVGISPSHAITVRGSRTTKYPMTHERILSGKLMSSPQPATMQSDRLINVPLASLQNTSTCGRWINHYRDDRDSSFLLLRLRNEEGDEPQRDTYAVTDMVRDKRRKSQSDGLESPHLLPRLHDHASMPFSLPRAPHPHSTRQVRRLDAVSDRPRLFDQGQSSNFSRIPSLSRLRLC